MLILVAAGCTCPATGGSGSGTATTPAPTTPAEPGPGSSGETPGDPPGTQPGTPAASAPGQGEECPAGTCAEGLQCVEFYGIAGASGPKFTSCEIPCPKGAGCPDGQSCVTIADGPGQVCRPKG